MSALYKKIADLPLQIDTVRLEALGGVESGAGRRITTIFVLAGAGHEGRGEDVNYAADEQEAFQATRLPDLACKTTLDAFCRGLDRLDLLWPVTAYPESRLYRRWALESAALDLALRQSNLSLAEALDRTPKPMRFVASLGLGDPPSTKPLTSRSEQSADLRFKIDLSEAWTPALIEELAGLGTIETVDLKGQYKGTFKGPAANLEQYRLVGELLPDALIEDPDWSPEIAKVLAPFNERISWDAVLHSFNDLLMLPFEPKWANIKPSRFGSLAELFRVYEYCECRGIRMYGGGQFEIGIGRTQNQSLASLFHADTANDLSPASFHGWKAGMAIDATPLRTEAGEVGFV